MGFLFITEIIDRVKETTRLGADAVLKMHKIKAETDTVTNINSFICLIQVKTVQ